MIRNTFFVHTLMELVIAVSLVADVGLLITVLGLLVDDLEAWTLVILVTTGVWLVTLPVLLTSDL